MIFTEGNKGNEEGKKGMAEFSDRNLMIFTEVNEENTMRDGYVAVTEAECAGDEAAATYPNF